MFLQAAGLQGQHGHWEGKVSAVPIVEMIIGPEGWAFCSVQVYNAEICDP